MTDDCDLPAARAALWRAEDAPGLSRRRLLQGALVVGAAAATPAWLRPLAPTAAAATTGRRDGVLVTILMGGGNDGLDTLVPTGDGAYYDARGAIAVAPGRALPVAPGFGFHPALAGLKARFDQGKVAVVQGVGYPDPELSHFTSMATWMRGQTTPLSGPPTGWLGRWLDLAGNPDGLRAIAVGDSCPLHLIGATTAATTLPTSVDGLFGADRRDPGDARLYDAVAALGAGPTGLGQWGDAAARAGAAAVGLATRVAPDYSPALPGGDLVPQMVLAARLINAGLGASVIDVGYGSFDDHAGEPADHTARLAELDAAIAAFYATLDPAQSGRVALMTFSEFGRRVEANGSAGTDHGTASCLFVVGDGVRGGLVGEAPSLRALDGDGNLVMTTDFRSVYASVLDGWLGGGSSEVLGGTFAPLPLFAAGPTGPVPPPGQRPPVVTSPPVPASTPGYWLVTAGGVISAFGRTAGLAPATGPSPVVGVAATPSRQGCWVAHADGGVDARGDATPHGSLAGTHLNGPIRGMAATGAGYWLVAADGGVFCFGDAAFHGSTGALRLNSPVVGMAASPSGAGYWLVAADGGVFCFRDAAFHGSTGALRLNSPVVGMAASPSGAGYWLVAADGGVFCFGDAAFHGSTGALRLVSPVAGMVATPTGQGYLLVARDGGVFTFGDATFRGSLGAAPPATPVVGIVA